MLEPLDSYWKRFWSRFFKDATPWARDNIGWGIIVLVVPPFAAYLRDRHAPMDWVLIKNSLLLYAFAFAIYILAYLQRTVKHLDDDRETRERALSAVVSEREQVIKEQEGNIRTLKEKPKRTPAEQHDYETVEQCLRILGQTGIDALRFLRKHGTLSFNSLGGCTADLPAELKNALWAYRHCASQGVVVGNNNLGKTVATYSISPKMETVLEELLFQEARPERSR
jgi:hypothetical protein